MKLPSIRIRKKTKLIILWVAAIILSAYAYITLPQGNLSSLYSKDTISVTFIDVGQGDSTLLVTPKGETLLIDGGEYDAFSTQLLPFLRSYGISKIDYAIATHYHSDHLGGIQRLVEANMIENLFLPDYPDSDNTRSKLEKSAKTTNTKTDFISMGDRIKTQCADLNIEVLSPVRGGWKEDNSHNNNSLVLRVSYLDTILLFTGDIETPAEKILTQRHDIECDILKVAHHGSSTSSSRGFLEAANPTYGIISAGKDNPYGHPHSGVLNRLENEDIRVYRTDIDGDITFIINKKDIEDIRFSK